MGKGLGDGLLRLCNGAWRDNDGDAVDIVEVVRCKNCVWCHTLEDLNYCENPRTPWIDDPDFDDITVADNDFCSYGERKDNE